MEVKGETMKNLGFVAIGLLLASSLAAGEDPKFKMTRTLILGERTDTLSWEATTDGKEHHRKDGEFESWMRMTWMGDELILKSRLKRHGEQGTNEAHYRLANEGKTLITAEWYHMPSSQHHNLWVFDREPEP